LRSIVSQTNIYINTRGKNANVSVIENIGRWVGKMLRIFGLGEGETVEIGWGEESTSGSVFNVGSDALRGDVP
jgi:cysteinyl-tRNA synthetase